MPPVQTPAQIPPVQTPPTNPEVAALLAEMHDIQLPDPVGFWPPAPGWIILFLVTLVVIVIGAVSLYRFIQHNRYRREALQQLKVIENDLLDRQDAHFAQALFTLLKQTALTAYPTKAQDIGRLYGKRWLAFLDFTSPGHLFDSPLGQRIVDALYRKSDADGENSLSNKNSLSQKDRLKCIDMAKHWIKRHRRKALETAKTTAVKSSPAKPTAMKSATTGGQHVPA